MSKDLEKKSISLDFRGLWDPDPKFAVQTKSAFNADCRACKQMVVKLE